jgi:hypothetical protein
MLAYDIAYDRKIVSDDYDSALTKNLKEFKKGNVKASQQYIYDNQKRDALQIVDKFNTTPIRVISIVKRTKVGMDGLMIQIAYNMTTHPDDAFCLSYDNVFFITAMSNVAWETDMRNRMPHCFRDNVHHHGKLTAFASKLKDLKNALIIIDEIDTGDKVDQRLDRILKDGKIMNIDMLEQNNIRFIFVSATMINELKDLHHWGEKHHTHFMEIPPSYIGHKDFVRMGIIQEFYAIDDDSSAEKWITEDILSHYGNDFRVHIIRTDEACNNFIRRMCDKHNVLFKNHTSADRITDEELASIFDNITNHTVIAIKGFYRRANLIPNVWKLKIGATHERYVEQFDTNVQIQGLPGRMSGYWREEIEQGHKTGPHRTSLKAIDQYEEFYKSVSSESSLPFAYNTPKKKLMTASEEWGAGSCAGGGGGAIVAPYSEKRVPYVVSGLVETDIIFTKIGKKEKTQFILSKITDERLRHFMQTFKSTQITMPQAEYSYNRTITYLVTANKHNSEFVTAITSEGKKTTHWQAFIDNREFRIVIVCWVVEKDKHLY